MKNGSIFEQLKMQEKQIANERENKVENMFANSQIAKTENNQSINQSNKQSLNFHDLGLSSALGIFTPEPSSDEPQQLIKPKKKKRNQRWDLANREVEPNLFPVQLRLFPAHGFPSV